MIRIGLVIGQLTFGGAEKQLVSLARGLARGGVYEPVVFCMSEHTQPFGDLLTSLGISWFLLPAGFTRYPQKALWLIRQSGRSRCSLLYGFLHAGNVYAALAGLVNRIPYICSIRNADPNLPGKLRIPSGLSCSLANYVIANSPSALRHLRTTLHVHHARASVIHNSLDMRSSDAGARDRLRAEWGVPLECTVIGTLANLKLQKNPLFFIEVGKVLSQLTENSPYFVWVGEGTERARIEPALDHLHPVEKSRILFPGARVDISNVLKTFDVFILTSSYEGLPNALMEAMAAGLPCLATRVEGTIDVVDDPNAGFLLWGSPNDPVEFAQILNDLLRDKDRMSRMGRLARAYVTRTYSSGRMVAEHTRIFDTILGRS